MSHTEMINTHYAARCILDRIQAGLETMGIAPRQATLDHLGKVDEFHVRGMDATSELIELLHAASDMHVLDLGCGLGGPARRLASVTGCRVTGIDLNEEFCAAGTAINRWLRFENQVELMHEDATNLERFGTATFDAAWTLHAAMNIADKPGFYLEVARVLKPDARFVNYDIVTEDKGELYYPVPWAGDAATSFLVTRDKMTALLRQAGFEIESIQDQTAEGLVFLTAALTRMAGSSPPPLGPHLVMGPETPLKLGNLAKNFEQGRVALVAVVCRLNA